MKELTSGKPIKLIIGFALPVLLGLAFQQAYTLTDTIIIGRQLGKNSLAARRLYRFGGVADVQHY